MIGKVDLNAFTRIPYCPWTYPSNWWSNIKLFFRKCKWAYQRITRGYADCDLWDFDSYVADFLSSALTYFAEHHEGYPDSLFPTDEAWTAYLKEMAEHFYASNESNDYFPMPAMDKWIEYADSHEEIQIADSWAKNPYSEEFVQEGKDLCVKRQEEMIQGFEMLKEVYFNLWD